MAKTKSVSITANTVAEGMHAVSRIQNYKHLIPQNAAVFYRTACEHLRQGNALTAVANIFSPENRLGLLDALAMKGLGVHYALRKQLVEQQTERLICE